MSKRKGKKSIAARIVPAIAGDAAPPAKAPMRISHISIAPREAEGCDVAATYRIPKPMPGVVPSASVMAQDEAMDQNYSYISQDAFAEGLGFMGYAYLAELSQRAEYRRPVEIIATEMCRKWVKIVAAGDDDKAEKVRKLTEAMERYNVQSVFRRLIELDGFFGRAHIFIDLGEDQGPELNTPLTLKSAKIGKGSLRRLTVVEPMWTFPNAYNSNNPLRTDYFKPTSWFVMGQQIHSSRLLTLVMREVPDLLKPAYSFGGLSLSQMMKPYVDNWLRTRQSVSDFVHSFSVFGLKTNMSGILGGGAADDMVNRAQLFNLTRDNRGMMMVDKDTEEFFNVSAPLAGLDELQAQTQEHMAAIAGIPLVKFFGITPSGLNASSEGEIACFDDWIRASQEKYIAHHLKTVMDVIQLSEFGEIDPGISAEFEPLRQLDEGELATARQAEAQTAEVYINAGVITPEEERIRLASSPDSAYHSLDLSVVVEPPVDPAAEGSPVDEPEE